MAALPPRPRTNVLDVSHRVQTVSTSFAVDAPPSSSTSVDAPPPSTSFAVGSPPSSSTAVDAPPRCFSTGSPLDSNTAINSTFVSPQPGQSSNVDTAHRFAEGSTPNVNVNPSSSMRNPSPFAENEAGPSVSPPKKKMWCEE